MRSELCAMNSTLSAQIVKTQEKAKKQLLRRLGEVGQQCDSSYGDQLSLTIGLMLLMTADKKKFTFCIQNAPLRFCFVYVIVLLLHGESVLLPGKQLQPWVIILCVFA